jgi:hypothetical protein
VASQAETAFGASIEGAMTALAIRFYVRMPSYDLTGRHEFLEVNGEGRAGKHDRDHTQNQQRSNRPLPLPHVITNRHLNQYMLTATT